MSQNETLISVCVVLRNQRQQVEQRLEQLTRLLSERYPYHELLVLDNASNDGTDQIVAARLRHTPNIRLLRLSRIYTLDTAVTAALDSAIGDYVILLDPETEVALIPSLVAKAQEGYDIVIVQRNLARLYSPMDRWAGRVLYGLASRILGYDVGMADSLTRLFSRRVVNALTQVRSRRRHLRHFAATVGYRQAYIAADSGQRLQRINRLEKFRFVVDLVVNNSIKPLRFATLLGVLASLLSMLYLFYILLVTVARGGQLAEGWLTISVTTTTMFFLLFVFLTILAEYIGRLLDESKDEPLYFVEYEDHSTITSYARAIEQDRLNIVQS